MAAIDQRTQRNSAMLRVAGEVPSPPEYAPFLPEKVEESFADRFAQVAHRHADRIAIRYGDAEITYRELDARSNRLARTLLARRGPNVEPIALLLDKGIAYIVACLGVWKAGKFVVPLDPRHPSARIARIYHDAEARTLLTDTANLTMARSLADEDALDLDTLPCDARDEPPALAIDPDTPAAILYTSGSTGQPKGAMLLQRNLLMAAHNYAGNLKLSPGDRVAFAYSLSVGIAFLIFSSALLSGATMHLVDLMQLGTEGLVEWLAARRITFLHCVPSLFRRLTAAIPPGMVFPHLRVVVLGGELSTRGDVELFRRCFSAPVMLVNNYGLTECTPVLQYVLRPDDTCDGPFMPAGYAVTGMDVRVLDSEGREAPPGEIGEIVLRTRYISPGYWKNPEATARAFRPDPDDPRGWYYHTGDLGSMQPDGRITCHGRKDFQVKIRGYRVETAEVELALTSLDAVKEAVIVARDDGQGDAMLVAYLVPAGEATLTTGDIQRHVRQHLPDYMAPAVVMWLDALPQTPTGKIDRLALPDPSSARGASDGAYEPPRTPTEEALARIWAKALRVERVGRDEDFFELGGHSLLAAQAFTEIARVFRRRLPISTLFQATTVGALAEILDREEAGDAWTSLAPVQPIGARRPFYCVHPAGGEVMSFRDLARQLGTDQPFYGLRENQSSAATLCNSIEEMAAQYLAEVRGRQPHGPYCLGGYSFGGLVAFEMARQVTAQGETVAALVLFDRPSTRRMSLGKSVKRRGLHILAKYRRLSPVGMLAQPFRSLALMLTKRFVWLAFQWYHLQGHPMPAALRGLGRNYFYRILSRRYRPQPYDGRLVILRAGDSPDNEFRDRALGWDALVRGGVEVRDVPGDHVSILSEAYVAALADTLRDVLDEAQ